MCGEFTIYLLILSLSGTRKFILYTGGEYGGSDTITRYNSSGPCSLLMLGGLQSVAVMNGPRWLRRPLDKDNDTKCTGTVKRAGAKGSRRLGHPGDDTPLHPQLPYSLSGLDVRYLPVCDGRHNRRRQTTTTTTTTPTPTTTDD